MIAQTLKRILTFSNLRRNTIQIIGPPQTGKTMFVTALTQIFNVGIISKIQLDAGSEFVFNNCLNKGFIIIEEPVFTKPIAADMLNVFAGTDIQVSKKFDDMQTLKKTPIITSSNNLFFGRGLLSEVMEEALQSRCFRLEFRQKFSPKEHMSSKELYNYINFNQ